MKAFAAVAFLVILVLSSIAGIVMCFKASVVLGIISLLVQGSGLLEFWGNLLGGYDIAQHLARALGLG